MKTILFKLYLFTMRTIAHFTVSDNSYVVLNGAGRSGSNGYVFYQYMQKNHPEIKGHLIEPWPSSHLKLHQWLLIGRAKYIFTTHQPFKIKNSQICVSFWHGVPLKRMGLLAGNTNLKNDLHNQKLWEKKANTVTSCSALYETLMSACIGIEGKQYKRLGFPRIDAIMHPNISKEQLLKDLFNQDDPNAKVGIYMPTFRYELEDSKVMKQIEAGNFFAFDNFNGNRLNENLKQNHQYLIVKLHPYEMKLVHNQHYDYSNITFLNNDYLFDKNLDLYQLLGQTDYLITDFSSIYFDYLYLNKPIYFVTNHLKQYQQKRGLLLEPYQDIVPGQCINSQVELIQVITQTKDNYNSRRKYWLKQINQVTGNSYCQNVYEYIFKR